jgi:diketogulonate reductase-like aldo/keto reductase
MLSANSTVIGVGFGTAALGGNTYGVVTMALEAGFRKFDTAEADWWYDQPTVGRALHDFFLDDNTESNTVPCVGLNMAISTKIPPWSLTSASDIRVHAANSRAELVGFCEDTTIIYGSPESDMETLLVPFPLDVYYIHAPKCWKGWHARCDNAPPTLDLRNAWMAMEAVAGIDHAAQRIGLSNVHPQDLLDIIHFVQQRSETGETNPPPRKPDVVQAFADPLQPALELREICEQHGIEFVSYSTLGTQHVMRNGNKNPVLTHPIVQELAAKHNRSVAEVVLSWARQNNMSVIPRSSKKIHIEELARMLTDPMFLSSLDLDKMNSISEVDDESDDESDEDEEL